MGQRAGLCKRFIVFRLIPSFGLWKWHFFRKFSFGCSFFFVPKFRFSQIYATFQLETGQRVGLHRWFIIFQPNSIVSASEMVFFFLKIFVSVLVLFVQFLIGNGSASKTPWKVYYFLPKFHRFGLRNVFFWKFLFRCFYFGARTPIRTNLCSFSIGNRSTSRIP